MLGAAAGRKENLWPAGPTGNDSWLRATSGTGRTR